jgi:hypothetical protein
VNFNRKILPPGLDEAHFEAYFSNASSSSSNHNSERVNVECVNNIGRMEATVRLSKQPVKWTDRMRRTFMVFLFAQMALCIAVIVLSVDQDSSWMVP